MYSGCRNSASIVLVLTLAATSLAACWREDREFVVPDAADAAPPTNSMSPLVGGRAALQFREQQERRFGANAFHVSEGKRLYDGFNCTGCHAHGGGDIGPPLMDDQWIYGGEIDQIYLTIAEGRPEGMPAFAGRVTSQQIWQLAAYVRTMSGHGPKPARPGRDDDINVPPEQER
jgi:cytochrome c oxidase cbb3-type subunit III